MATTANNIHGNSMSTPDKYVFFVDWFDPHAQLTRKYTLTFYPEDNSFDMFDLKLKKTFLKRTKQPGITINDLLQGNTVTIVSRQLTITGYADSITSSHLGKNIQKAVVICPAAFYPHFGRIIDAFLAQDFHLLNARMFQTHSSAISPNAFSHSDGIQRALILYMSRHDVFNKLSELLEGFGEQSFYQKLKLDTRDGNHLLFSKDEQESTQEYEKLFKNAKDFPRTAKFEHTTCCVIRPHAVSHGSAGKIIDDILKSGFTITDIQMYQLVKVDAEEFLEVYKNVVPEYHSMVDELCAGPLIAMEIYQEGRDDVAQNLKDLAGPPDPELAKTIRPKSLRAKYGEDAIRNGIHCTDVPDDAILEIEYFFNILSRV